MSEDKLNLIIVTGMSGAGRSRALSALEDFGFFAIDNLPPAMIPQIAALSTLQDSSMQRIAVACDIRGGAMFADLEEVLEEDLLLDSNVVILYLDASDSVLINRFKESRRPHPLEEQAGSLSAAIKEEREMLRPIRAQADVYIDTSELRASELRARIQKEFNDSPVVEQMGVTLSSFGFKYGPPVDADIIFDVRFLPNPFYDPALRNQSGLDEDVSNYVLNREETKQFLSHWFPLLLEVLPRYQAEGKLTLSIALGCTGGRHRSVALTELSKEFLEEQGYRTSVVHRDINRDDNH